MGVLLERADHHQTLAEVVRTHDFRLWEGFPLLLVNLAKKTEFNYQKVTNFLDKATDRKQLKELLLLSLALYKEYHLHFDWAKELHDQLDERSKKQIKKYVVSLDSNRTFKVNGHEFSAERVKQVFQNYFQAEAKEVKKTVEKYQDLSLEYSLSQIFSPKQKEIFLKKVHGENLTKTEREYFSRRVKKKVMALANPEFFRCAQLLLNS